jgi:hypothetical protein
MSAPEMLAVIGLEKSNAATMGTPNNGRRMLSKNRAMPIFHRQPWGDAPAGFM